jgi:hypothetical protein
MIDQAIQRAIARAATDRDRVFVVLQCGDEVRVQWEWTQRPSGSLLIAETSFAEESDGKIFIHLLSPDGTTSVVAYKESP